MRETAKHDDIEDVLSSIRRLVSDSSSADRNGAQPPIERLVLTPALRVADAEGAVAVAQPVDLDPEPEPEPLNEDAGSDDETNGDTVAEVSFDEDETSPDRPVEDLHEAAEGAPEGAGGNLPFGLSSFTAFSGAANNDADMSDVVMLRDEQTEEVANTQERPQEEAAAAQTSSPEPVVEEPIDDAEAATADEDEPREDAPEDDASGHEYARDGSDMDWPEPDAALDAEGDEEPEAWSDDEPEAMAGEDEHGWDAVAGDEHKGQEAPQDSADVPKEDAQFEPSEVKEDVSAADGSDDALEDLQYVQEVTDVEATQDSHQFAESADNEAPDSAAAGDDADAEADGSSDQAPYSALSRIDIGSEPAFEPEHGDTDWSDTESVQPALDIAAVREARGEGLAPEPEAAEALDTPEPEPDDTTPAAMPIFARSRRRPMTSLDDLITPEGEEPDTVADAVSQAMADNALDRQEAAAPMAESTGGIADESFDVDAHAGDDLSLIDEEALRDLIAQVVREELQGVLGQRITRNVRKMVRREIRLALAAEDFE